MKKIKSSDSSHYETVAQVIEYFVLHQKSQPGLEELCRHVGMSKYHLQRVFSQWVGVSPKQYLQYLTKQHAKHCLRSESVLEAALSSGLSGSGRLHDLMVCCEGVTPGEYKRQGKGLCIHYGRHYSPFGQCLLAVTERGVCKLAFFDSAAQWETLVGELFAEWGEARIIWDDAVTMPVIESIFPPYAERRSGGGKPVTLNVFMKGSSFQLKVWEALLAIPLGGLCSYQKVAERVQSPNAFRAAASAIASNHIAYLIPCHRVIRGNGDFNQYRWGLTRKQSMIAWEACQRAEVGVIEEH